jgi:disulfide bond formation protein DsbB
VGAAGFSLFFALLTVFANLTVLTVAGLWLAWLVAATATAGSLSFSEVAGFPPCDLCWYQRIAMYPLVVVLGVAAWRGSVGVPCTTVWVWRFHDISIPFMALSAFLAVVALLALARPTPGTTPQEVTP